MGSGNGSGGAAGIASSGGGVAEWAGRLGILVPSANAVMERDGRALLPPGVSVHAARMPLTRDDEDQIAALADFAPDCATTLAHAGVQAIGFGCTTGSLLGGLGYDRAIVDSIQEITGVPTTTTSTAVVQALAALDIGRLLLLSPYPGWLQDKVIAFLRQQEVEVVTEYHWDRPEPRDIETVTPQEIVREAVDHVGQDVDGVFVSCTGFRGVEAIVDVESQLGVPVVSSNQATFWSMMSLAETPWNQPLLGRLNGRPVPTNQ